MLKFEKGPSMEILIYYLSWEVVDSVISTFQSAL